MKNLLFLFVFTLFGCATRYIPVAPCIPLLTEKNETVINAGASTNSISLQAAHAISDKYAFIANTSVSYGNFSKKHDLGIPSTGFYSFFYSGDYKHWNADLGFGRYSKFAEKLIYELYGGLGYGYASVPNYEYHNNQYGSVFLQFNIGRKTKHVGLAISQKFAYTSQIYSYSPYLNDIRTSVIPTFMSQTSGIIRTGGEHIKFWVSPGLNLSYAWNNPDPHDDILSGDKYYSVLNLAIGMHFNF